MPFVGELLEHARIGRRPGRRLLEDGQLAACSNRISRSCGLELMLNSWPADGVDLLLDALSLALEALLERREPVDVDRDARPFHLGEHADERHLDVVETAARAASASSCGSNIAREAASVMSASSHE